MIRSWVVGSNKVALGKALTLVIFVALNPTPPRSFAVDPGQTANSPAESTPSFGSPSGTHKPLNRTQLLGWVAGGVSNDYLARLVQQRGLDFNPTENDLQRLRAAGAAAELLNALRSAIKVGVKSEETPEAVLQHTVRRTEALRKKQFAEAEKEFRAALGLAPQEAALRIPLAMALLRQGKGNDAITELREAVRLQPEEAELHQKLSVLLGRIKDDMAGSVAEQREAVRLESNYSERHYNLAVALQNSGVADEAIAEYRMALRLQPDLIDAHYNIGYTLESKNDVEYVISEYREEIRLHPDHEQAHYRLARALGITRDFEGSVREMREVVRLQPDSIKMRLTLALVLALSGQPAAAARESLSVPAVWYFLGTLISLGTTLVWHRKRKRRSLSG